MPAKPFENVLEQRQGVEDATGANRGIPKRLELLPTGRIGDVPEPIPGRGLGGSTPPDRAPAVEVSIGSPIAAFQLSRLQQRWAKDDVARVVEIPIPMQHAPFRLHPSIECGVRVGRQDVIGRGLDAVQDGPFDGAIEHIGPVVVHPEHEAAVDHHTEVVQPPNRRVIVTTDVLVFALIREVGRIYGLEADEQAAQSGGHGLLQQPRLFQHRLDRAGGLPEPSHATHAVEERLGEGWTAKKMVIEKVQMASRKTRDLG